MSKHVIRIRFKLQLIVETLKRYDQYTVPKEQWKSLMAFINAASNFSSQKVLLKKI